MSASLLTLGDGLFAWAKTVELLTALIGEGEDIRFYPLAVQEQKPLPYVIYDEARDSEAAQHDAPAGAATSMVTFSCFADTIADAERLAQIIYSALMTPARFRGAMGNVTVQAVLYESSSSAYQWEEQEFAVDAVYKFCYDLG